MHTFEMVRAFYSVFYTVVIFLMLAGLITLSYEDNNEKARPGVEYNNIETFRNMPVFLEHVLGMLQKNSEILETDDVRFFQKDVDNEECENEKVKREVDQCSAPANNVPNDESKPGGSKYKRQSIIEVNNKVYTTKINENADKSIENDSKELLKDITKREIIKSEFVDKPFTKYLADMNNQNIRRAEKNTNQMDTPKASGLKLGNDFAGIDWSLFYLSPEEVEEKAIRIEQIIEEHNKKSRKK